MLSPVHMPALSRGETRELLQRIVCWWFGMSVIGQLWLWPLALLAAWHSAVFAALLALYVAYIWGPGLRAAEEEGPAPLRRLGVWKLMGERFNARLIKTADLPPDRPYVFACFPHGVTALSGWLAFGTEATGFGELFEGLRPYPCTLESNFRCPLLREYCLLHGLRSCARRAVRALLRRPGAAAVLFPGGASEAVETEEGAARAVLRKRRGYARAALEAGADLVPVACFGETDLFHVYRPPPGTFWARFQAVSHFVLPGRQPLFHGAGVFSDPGLLPLARPLTTVVGAPIPVARWEGAPSGDAFEAAAGALHARFERELAALWEAWRRKVDPGRVHPPLEVVA